LIPPDPPAFFRATSLADDAPRGSLVYLGFGQVGAVSYPASQFASNSRTVISGQRAG
jgi:S-(hydroxymethyl)glutathione dehydrogenase/alcohol dehydrogenase